MPQLFGRYELHDLLGRGGMGEVYRAVDTVRDRTVALKLLPRHLASDEGFKNRFRRESRLAAKLNDPHIIPIHDFGEIDGQLFIDMRLVEGRDLGSVIAVQGQLPLSTAATIVGQVASALHAAHRSGLVHRDVKPSNVLLAGWSESGDTEPFAYLVDFGIARSENQEGTLVTATSGTIGTIAYLAPERIGGAPGDGRTDIYALGCVLFEALTGVKPYEGEMYAVMYAHLHSPVPSVTALRPDLPPALDAVIARAMAKNPNDRYATAGAFATALRHALGWTPQPSAMTPSNPLPSPSWSPVTPVPHLEFAPRPAPANARDGTPGLPPVGAVPPAQATPPAPFAAGPLTPGPPWHPSGPLPPTPVRSPGSPDRHPVRRALLVAGAIAVIAGIVVALVVTLGGGSPHRKRTQAGSTTNSTSPASSSSAGSPGSWQQFAAFAPLVGTRDGDSAHAFQHGTCSLAGASTARLPGLVDQVECSYSGSSVHSAVARFGSAAAVISYLDGLATSGTYHVLPFRMGDPVVGLLFVGTSSDHADVLTYLCGLPTYLVQFYGQGVSATSVREQYWAPATLTDDVPQPCNEALRGPQPGSQASPGTADKVVNGGSFDQVSAYVQFGHADWKVVMVRVGNELDIAVVTQTGAVHFWTWDRVHHQLTAASSSQYPYDPSLLGAAHATVQAAQLTGMAHAVFIVTGTFSTDESGNAVAFGSRDGEHWGAIKARPDGALQITTEGVGVKGLGLSQGFDFSHGLLVTSDCSGGTANPDCSNLIVKYWRWNESAGAFLLDHRG